MSTGQETLADLRQALIAGEIDADEFKDRLGALDLAGDRDELWARWASQGLFDDPIDQEGYTSFAGGRVREVDADGQR